MTYPGANRKKIAMRELVNGLYKDSIRYDSHQLADQEFIQALVASVAVPVPWQLSIQGGSGNSLFQALGLLVLDGLNLELPKAECDEGMIVGLILLWSIYIQPAFFEDTARSRRLAVKLAIEKCTDKNVILDLVEHVPSVLDWSTSELDWIVEEFEYLRGVQEDGEVESEALESGELSEEKPDDEKEAGKPRRVRTARNRRDSALLYLLRRLERAADSLGLRISDVFPEVAGGGAQVPEAPTPTTSPTLDWHRRLSQIVADYRTYARSELDRQLGSRELVPRTELYHFYGVYRPVSQQKPVLMSLQDICKPGLRTALLDYPDRDTTTALLCLLDRCCGDETTGEPVALRVDALDYKEAGTTISILEYLAEKVYPSGQDADADRIGFVAAMKKAEVVFLVDNLSQLSLEEQIKIGLQFRRAAGLIFAASPATADRDLDRIGGEGTARAELAPLEAPQVQWFLALCAGQSESGFDTRLARHVALRELPEIGRSPFGLGIICEQVLAGRSDSASIAARFVQELLNRDGMEPSQRSLAIEALARLALRKYIECPDEGASAKDVLEFDEKWALDRLPLRDLEDWPWIRKVSLLYQTGSETYRFLNQEVLGFLVAQGEAQKNISDEFLWPYTPNVFKAGFAGVAMRHFLALLGRKAETSGWLRNDQRGT